MAFSEQDPHFPTTLAYSATVTGLSQLAQLFQRFDPEILQQRLAEQASARKIAPILDRIIKQRLDRRPISNNVEDHNEEDEENGEDSPEKVSEEDFDDEATEQNPAQPRTGNHEPPTN